MSSIEKHTGFRFFEIIVTVEKKIAGWAYVSITYTIHIIGIYTYVVFDPDSGGRFWYTDSYYNNRGHGCKDHQ